MKRWVSLLVASGMAISLGAPALANATVYTTSGVNLREGPGLGYAKVGALQAGTGLEYLGRISTDESGEDWYQVRYYGDAVWISSSYAHLDAAALADSYAGEGYLDYNQEITAIPLATPQAQITAVPSFDDEATLAPTFGVPGMIELSGYYRTSLKGSAISLGLTSFRHDENSALQNKYYNDALLIAGNDSTEHILVSGAGYSVYGVYVGMDIASAQAVLTAAGLTQSAGTMGLYFQHRGLPPTEDNPEGFDSSISALTDGSGTITEISWSSYGN